MGWIAIMGLNALISRDFQWPRRLLAAIALLFVPVAAQAQPQNFENLDRLDSLVAMTVGANLGEPGGPAAPVDRRLRLAPCPATPTVTGPTFGAAIVSCPQIGWRLRVPLVGAPAAAPAPVAARAAAPVAVAAKPEALIRKGDPVELIAGNEGFSVSRAMVADEDGAVGATIRVRQDSKSAPISARVERAGLVRAPGI